MLRPDKLSRERTLSLLTQSRISGGLHIGTPTEVPSPPCPKVGLNITISHIKLYTSGIRMVVLRRVTALSISNDGFQLAVRPK